MAAAAGRGRTRDKVGHTSVLWRGARVGILFLIIYTVILEYLTYISAADSRPMRLSSSNFSGGLR